MPPLSRPTGPTMLDAILLPFFYPDASGFIFKLSNSTDPDLPLEPVIVIGGKRLLFHGANSAPYAI